MTISLDRSAGFDSDADFDADFEGDIELNADTDFELGDLMYGCVDGGYHRDEYVLHEDTYSVTRKCDECGDTWSESKDD